MTAEAADDSNPLLERLRFMAISASNLDEFFMVRVAGLKDQVKVSYHRPDDKTQMSPQQQIHEISKRVHSDIRKLYRILTKSILPSLRQQGIAFARPADLAAPERVFLEEYYRQHVFPVLTPLGIDASHPFPMLANRSLNIAVLLASEGGQTEEDLFAVVQVPAVLGRYIELPSHGKRRTFVLLEEVIQQFMVTLFPGNRVLESACFRITRNADITFDQESAEDLLEEIEKELKKRKRGAAVRLEVDQSMSATLVDTLRDWLELELEDIYSIKGPLELTLFSKFYNLPAGDHLRFEQLIPQPPLDLLGETEIFDAISRKHILMFHPYESFDPVVHFVNHAADDPQVLAIKQTLYRVSGHSPVVSALARAAENGKQVTVLLELKA